MILSPIDKRTNNLLIIPERGGCNISLIRHMFVILFTHVVVVLYYDSLKYMKTLSWFNLFLLFNLTILHGVRSLKNVLR